MPKIKILSLFITLLPSALCSKTIYLLSAWQVNFFVEAPGRYSSIKPRVVVILNSIPFSTQSAFGRLMN